MLKVVEPLRLWLLPLKATVPVPPAKVPPVARVQFPATSMVPDPPFNVPPPRETPFPHINAGPTLKLPPVKTNGPETVIDCEFVFKSKIPAFWVKLEKETLAVAVKAPV